MHRPVIVVSVLIFLSLSVNYALVTVTKQGVAPASRVSLLNIIPCMYAGEFRFFIASFVPFVDCSIFSL